MSTPTPYLQDLTIDAFYAYLERKKRSACYFDLDSIFLSTGVEDNEEGEWNEVRWDAYWRGPCTYYRLGITFYKYRAVSSTRIHRRSLSFNYIENDIWEVIHAVNEQMQQRNIEYFTAGELYTWIRQHFPKISRRAKLAALTE